MPLYLTEADVAALLTPADAVEAVEACFQRLAARRGRERARGGGCGWRTASSRSWPRSTASSGSRA